MSVTSNAYIRFGQVFRQKPQNQDSESFTYQNTTYWATESDASAVLQVNAELVNGPARGRNYGNCLAEQQDTFRQLAEKAQALETIRAEELI